MVWLGQYKKTVNEEERDITREIAALFRHKHLRHLFSLAKHRWTDDAWATAATATFLVDGHSDHHHRTVPSPRRQGIEKVALVGASSQGKV